MPPAPIAPVISYGPSCVPAGRGTSTLRVGDGKGRLYSVLTRARGGQVQHDVDRSGARIGLLLRDQEAIAEWSVVAIAGRGQLTGGFVSCVDWKERNRRRSFECPGGHRESDAHQPIGGAEEIQL